MASKGYLPTREEELAAWAQNFSTLITAAPTMYGLSSALATALAAQVAGYVAALAAARSPSSDSRQATQAKDAARDTLVANVRVLVRTVQGTPAVTAAQKTALGITVRDAEPSPIPVPSTAPLASVVAVAGRSVKLKLANTAEPARRGKPDGVAAAAVYSFVGTTPPASLDGWQFEGNATRTRFDVTFPADVAAGAQVWICACWLNPRLQPGPVSAAITTTVAGGISAAA